jgi:hypothetical protein
MFAMTPYFRWIFLLGWIWPQLFSWSRVEQPVPQNQDIILLIYSPQPGQAVQGIVPIDVSIIVPDLDMVVLEFRYQDHPTDTWFQLLQTGDPIEDGILAQWDTTTITDGEYDLRLVAFTGLQQYEYLVSGLRVRNYTPVETETPTPSTQAEAGTPVSTLTPTRTVLAPTLTPLPTNPAVFTPQQFGGSMGVGAGVVLVLFILIGAYIGLRHLSSGRG